MLRRVPGILTACPPTHPEFFRAAAPHAQSSPPGAAPATDPFQVAEFGSR